jgi:hypothetical protein
VLLLGVLIVAFPVYLTFVAPATRPRPSCIIAIGKIAISLLSAFAIVYFRFPFKMFWSSGPSSSR